MQLVKVSARDQGTVVEPKPQRPPNPWEEVLEAEKNSAVVEVTVKTFNKGGIVVMYGPIKGFIPYSSMASLQKGHMGDLSFLVGRTIRAKIVSADMQGNKKEIILSEKKAIQSERMAMLKLGNVVKGVVSAVEEYGAFVDLKELPGVSGLIHKTEVSWDTIMTVEEVLQKGQIVTAKIIDLDARRGRLGLSLKQMTDDPTRESLDRVEWGVTRSMMLEVQDLVERLKTEEGINEVYIGRQAVERGVVSQDLGVYLTREEVEGGFNIVARIGRTCQELMVMSTLSRDDMKAALARAARGA